MEMEFLFLPPTKLSALRYSLVNNDFFNAKETTMKRLHLALLAALALGVSGVAYADHHCKKHCDEKHCDYKKHGMLDADANKDGAVSRDEFLAAHKARAEEMFSAMDGNNDGKIDAAERKAMHGHGKADKKGHDGEHCNMPAKKLYDKGDKAEKNHD